MSQNGQALLELAVFGSLVLLVFGLLLNYGLNADFNQQALMESFRTALRIADPNGTEGNASYLLIKDRHVPSPSSPFATGSVVPQTGSASVLWDFEMQETASTQDQLAKITLQIQNVPEITKKTAGFRTEDNVSQAALEKYREIYGASNVCDDAECNGGQRCVRYEDNPETGLQECVEWVYTVQIIDSCEGEVISYAPCVLQARQIVDEEVCTQQCEKGSSPGSASSCAGICQEPMGIPWYAQGYQEVDPSTNAYVFPVLDQLFAGIKAMGLQPSYTKAMMMDNTLTRRDSPSAASTTDALNWQEEATRKIVYIYKSNNTTVPPPGTSPNTTVPQEVISSECQSQNCQGVTRTWTTPWSVP